MRFDVVIQLVATGGYTQDGIGVQRPTAPASRTVYANEWDISSREFYDAGQSGMKLARAYQIRSIDYADEVSAIVDGIEFNVARARRKGEFTILMLERVAGDG